MSRVPHCMTHHNKLFKKTPGGIKMSENSESQNRLARQQRRWNPCWRYFELFASEAGDRTAGPGCEAWPEMGRWRSGWASVKVSGLPKSLEQATYYQNAETSFSKVSRKLGVTYLSVCVLYIWLWCWPGLITSQDKLRSVSSWSSYHLLQHTKTNS